MKISTMETAIELYGAVRAKFPAISAQADLLHVRRFGELSPTYAYSWFESLADALNEHMRADTPVQQHLPLFRYLNGVFFGAGPQVRACIDVAFVENLFWQVPHRECQPYWQQLPENLRQMYRNFHRREP